MSAIVIAAAAATMSICADIAWVRITFDLIALNHSCLELVDGDSRGLHFELRLRCHCVPLSWAILAARLFQATATARCVRARAAGISTRYATTAWTRITNKLLSAYQIELRLRCRYMPLAWAIVVDRLLQARVVRDRAAIFAIMSFGRWWAKHMRQKFGVETFDDFDMVEPSGRTKLALLLPRLGKRVQACARRLGKLYENQYHLQRAWPARKLRQSTLQVALDIVYKSSPSRRYSSV